jgi:hypothetical protein
MRIGSARSTFFPRSWSALLQPRARYTRAPLLPAQLHLSNDNTTCARHATLGEVTFTELTDGDIGITVALLGTDEKFKDLMFNFVGPLRG